MILALFIHSFVIYNEAFEKSFMTGSKLLIPIWVENLKIRIYQVSNFVDVFSIPQVLLNPVFVDRNFKKAKHSNKKWFFRWNYLLPSFMDIQDPNTKKVSKSGFLKKIEKWPFAEKSIDTSTRRPLNTKPINLSLKYSFSCLMGAF